MTTARRARTPPHDLDAETALLGSCLLTRDAVLKALDAHVSHDDFYKPTHQTIFRALLDLYADDQPIDPTTVAAHLRRHGTVDQIGGRQALLELQTGTPLSANAAAYATTVHTAAVQRRFLTLAGELQDAIYDNRPYEPLIEQLARPAGTDPTGWVAADLVEILRHDLKPPEPELLCRDDQRHLLYLGRIHSVNGESESLKSWLALHAAAQELQHGRCVLYLDFEDTAESICARLIALGVGATAIIERLVYIRPDEPLTLAAGTHLERLITARQPSIAVIDGVTEAMSLEGLDLLDNADVATWLSRLPRRIKGLGPAVVLIDHVPKNTDNRKRGGIGGQHKLAGIDVSYLVEPIHRLAHVADGGTEPITGTSRITVEKDRPGGVRSFAIDRYAIGELHVTAYADGGVTAHIIPAAPVGEGGFRPTAVMEKLSKALEQEAAPIPAREVRDLIRGKNPVKDRGLRLLVNEGYVVTQKSGNSVLHRSVRAYRAADDPKNPTTQEPPEDEDDDL